MKKIPLTNSDEFALVDSKNFARVSRYKWYLRGIGYVEATRHAVEFRKLSHFVMGKPPKGKIWDHKNLNKLDNRERNLRVADLSQNQANKRRAANNTSGYKGVNKNGKGWIASVRFNRKRFYFGTFGSPERAARAYDAGAYLLHGQYANFNFPICRFPREPK